MLAPDEQVLVVAMQTGVSLCERRTLEHAPAPRSWLLGAIACTACGCAATVPIESTFPAPLVETIPLSVGVHYDEDFSNYSYAEKLPEGTHWTVTLGTANVRMFNRLMGSIFRQVVPVETIPTSNGDVDAVIKPVLEEYAFLTPRESGSDFYAVSIRYRIEFYTPDGQLLGTWPINSYGKTRSRIMNAKQSLADATVMALRDAEAALAVDFHERPQVLALLTEEEKDDESSDWFN